MQFLTSRTHPQGREIVCMISQQPLAVYKTGSSEERTAAEAQARAAQNQLIEDLIAEGLIVAGRQYPLPTLQQAFATLNS